MVFEAAIKDSAQTFRSATGYGAKNNATQSAIDLMVEDGLEFVIMANRQEIARYADPDEIFDSVKKHLWNYINRESKEKKIDAAAKAEDEATGDDLKPAAEAEEEATGDDLKPAAKAEEKAANGSTTSIKTPSISRNAAASVIVGSKRPAIVTPTNPGPTPAKKPASSSKLGGLGNTSSTKKQGSITDYWRRN